LAANPGTYLGARFWVAATMAFKYDISSKFLWRFRDNPIGWHWTWIFHDHSVAIYHRWSHQFSAGIVCLMYL